MTLNYDSSTATWNTGFNQWDDNFSTSDFSQPAVTWQETLPLKSELPKAGFQIKKGTYTPFPFWHQFTVGQLNNGLGAKFSFKRVDTFRLMLKGAYSRKFDKVRKKRRKRIF